MMDSRAVFACSPSTLNVGRGAVSRTLAERGDVVSWPSVGIALHGGETATTPPSPGSVEGHPRPPVNHVALPGRGGMEPLTRSVIFSSNPGDALALVAEAALPLDRHPVAVYLAGLAPGSRRTQRAALRVIAMLVAPGATELTLPWWALDYAHTTAIRSRLAERFAPATSNRMLAALRGTLKSAFKLGLIDSDRMTRACSVEPVRGSRVMKGRALSRGELAALFESCDPSTAGGARNAALLGLLYGGGLRRAEVVAVDLADFDPASGAIVVRGAREQGEEGLRDQRQPRRTRRVARPSEAIEPGPLFFPVTKGGTILGHRMTDGAVAELVRRARQEVEDRRVQPTRYAPNFHRRHAGRRGRHRHGATMAGHASPTTTSRVRPAWGPDEEEGGGAVARAVREAVVSVTFYGDTSGQVDCSRHRGPGLPEHEQRERPRVPALRRLGPRRRTFGRGHASRGSPGHHAGTGHLRSACRWIHPRE